MLCSAITRRSEPLADRLSLSSSSSHCAQLNITVLSPPPPPPPKASLLSRSRFSLSCFVDFVSKELQQQQRQQWLRLRQQQQQPLPSQEVDKGRRRRKWASAAAATAAVQQQQQQQQLERQQAYQFTCVMFAHFRLLITDPFIHFFHHHHLHLRLIFECLCDTFDLTWLTLVITHINNYSSSIASGRLPNAFTSSHWLSFHLLTRVNEWQHRLTGWLADT